MLYLSLCKIVIGEPVLDRDNIYEYDGTPFIYPSIKETQFNSILIHYGGENFDDFIGNSEVGCLLFNNGIISLTREDLYKIKSAKSAFKPTNKGGENIYKLLEFLETQVDYALENCNRPAILIDHHYEEDDISKVLLFD